MYPKHILYSFSENEERTRLCSSISDSAYEKSKLWYNQLTAEAVLQTFYSKFLYTI